MSTFHDVVVIGGGGAGLRAAIAVAETNPALRVAVVSKVYPMRSHTVSAEGGAAAVAADDDSLDEHAYDTVSGSDWLCDQDAVEAFVAEAPRELLRLEHWGCPWSRQPDGRIAVRAFGGMKKRRTWFAADRTGFHLLHTLFQTALSYSDIVRYDEWYVTKILVDDGRAYGVVAIELATGRIETITASTVIVCTGGCGRVYPFTTNANIKTGDGMALAYRAGAALKDMEFVQYHPTGLPFTGILITEAARAEGGWLLNKDGYRYLQDYDLGTPSPTPELRSMELGPRDRLSQAFVHEQEKGRTIDTPYGPVVNLDLRHLGAKLIDAKLPFVRELCSKYQNIDPVTSAGPGASGRALHDGRDPHRHPGRDVTRGSVRRRRGGLRQHQRRQSAGVELAAGVSGVRQPGRPGRRGVRRPLPQRRTQGCRSAGPGRGAQAHRGAGPARGGPRADRGHPDRDADHDGERGRHLSGRRLAGQGGASAGASCSCGTSMRRSTTTARTSTPSWSHCSSSASCSMLPRASSLARRAGRSRAVPTSAPTSRPATTTISWRIRWYGANRTGPAGSRICR